MRSSTEPLLPLVDTGQAMMVLHYQVTLHKSCVRRLSEDYPAACMLGLLLGLEAPVMTPNGVIFLFFSFLFFSFLFFSFLFFSFLFFSFLFFSFLFFSFLFFSFLFFSFLFFSFLFFSFLFFSFLFLSAARML